MPGSETCHAPDAFGGNPPDRGRKEDRGVRSSISAWIVSVVSLTTVAACEQATGGSSGPPHVMQVFARERIPTMDAMGNPVIALEPRLAFGDHPDIPLPSADHPDGDDRDVTAAVARDGQRIRVVVDELLRGN